MSLDLCERLVPVLRLLRHHATDQILYQVPALAIIFTVRHEEYILTHDALVHNIDVSVVEGWKASQHLVEEGSEAVDVQATIMPNAGQHLWAHVLWRPAKGVRSLLLRDDLRKPEISNSYMSINVK